MSTPSVNPMYSAYYFNINNNKYGAKPINAVACAKKIYYKDNFNIVDSANVLDKLVYEKWFLPKWAQNSPHSFFKAADNFEQKTAIVYNVFEFTLQSELNLNQNVEIVDSFIKKYLPNKYYAYAIRQKKIDNQSPTAIYLCYLMFSERIIDEIERKDGRSASKFFSRYNSKKPELGGTKKDNQFTKVNLNNSLLAARKTFVAITNKILTKYQINKALNYNNLVHEYTETLKPISVDSLEILSFAHNTKEARLLQKIKTNTRKQAQLLRELKKLKEDEAKLRDELNELISFKESLPVLNADENKLVNSVNQDKINENEQVKIDSSKTAKTAQVDDNTTRDNFSIVIKQEADIEINSPTLADAPTETLNSLAMDIDTSNTKSIENDESISTITAYNAMQIKNLLTRLTAYLRTVTNINSGIMQKMLSRITTLKKAVNLQVIKDKYHTYSTDSNTVYYFVKNDKGIHSVANGLNHKTYQFNLSSISSEYNKDISSVDLQNTRILDLKNAKIIAEALAGNKQAINHVMQIKNDKIHQIEL